jgi:hypothetical protein
MVKRTTKKKSTKPLNTCKGAGWNLRKSPSKITRQAASRKLNACKVSKRKKK